MWLLNGLWGDYLDPVYQMTFSVFLSTIVLFTFGSAVGTMAMRYRSGAATLGHSAWTQLKWSPFLIFFFSGLPYHVTTALASHIVGYNMQWSTTVKDVTGSNVGTEVPEIFRRHWRMFCLLGGSLLACVIMTTGLVPMGYQIADWVAILPLIWMTSLHILYPFVLNPYVLLFQF